MQVMETCKNVLGLEHPHTLTGMDNLASTYSSQGRWKEAEELEVQVVETRKNVLGLQHPDTLTSMNNLTSIYRDQGRWKGAASAIYGDPYERPQPRAPSYLALRMTNKWDRIRIIASKRSTEKVPLPSSKNNIRHKLFQLSTNF